MTVKTTARKTEWSRELALDLYTTMVRIRAFEERVGELFVRGESAGGMLHLSIGEEAAAAGVGKAMAEGDSFTTHHRGHGVFLGRGGEPGKMLAEIGGKIDGYCRGKGGSMHIADMSKGHLGANAIVGGGVPTVIGAGLTYQVKQQPHCSVAFFGDGTMQQGILYESMNLAALWRLPVLFVCVNNQYGMGTRIDKAAADLRFDQRAATFGLDGQVVDGTDVLKVHEVAGEMLAQARHHGRPGFLSIDCYRFYGHARKDKSPYRSEEEEEQGRKRDPIAQLRQELPNYSVAETSELDAIDEAAGEEMDRALDYAAKAERPAHSTMFEDVYDPATPAPVPVAEHAAAVLGRD